MCKGESSGGTVLGDIVSHWKEAAAGFVIGLTIFGSGVLTLLPEDMASAAMAPSLMQDEKGYITIFEKVCSVWSATCLRRRCPFEFEGS